MCTYCTFLIINFCRIKKLKKLYVPVFCTCFCESFSESFSKMNFFQARLREDELAKQEREIIESLEREEKEKTGSGTRESVRRFYDFKLLCRDCNEEIQVLSPYGIYRIYCTRIYFKLFLISFFI